MLYKSKRRKLQFISVCFLIKLAFDHFKNFNYFSLNQFQQFKYQIIKKYFHIKRRKNEKIQY